MAYGVALRKIAGGIVSRGAVDVTDVVAKSVQTVAKATPSVWRSVQSRLSIGGAPTGVDAVVSWIRNNKANAAMTAVTLASVGVSVADSIRAQDPESASALDDVANNGLFFADEEKIVEAAAASETLKLGVADSLSDLMTAKAVAEWARSHYGSMGAALEAHRLHQAFFEMPHEDVMAYFALRGGR